jgi:hypothetical protein
MIKTKNKTPRVQGLWVSQNAGDIRMQTLFRTASLKGIGRIIAITLGALMAPILHADPIFQTIGTFEWDATLGDQTAAENAGNVSGLGTSSATTGIGIRGSGPNLHDFVGVTGDGALPGEPFRIGNLTFFNGDIGFNVNGPFVDSILLDIVGLECDSNDPICPSVNFGQVPLDFVFTPNIPNDPVASADSFCIVTFGGAQQCAWVFEFDTKSFDILAQFGSLNVFEIIPVTPGGFVTIGQDPTMNVIRTALEPITIDIKPGSDLNSINLKSKGKIPVAILTTNTGDGDPLDFDAVQVDPLSVEFGPNAATEAHGRGHVKDVDSDGDMDLVLHFQTRQSGIACGDTEASLTGVTFSGDTIQGTNLVNTVGCKK